MPGCRGAPPTGDERGDAEIGPGIVDEGVAVVEMGVAGGEAAGDEQVGTDPRVHREVDAVEHFGLLAVVVDEVDELLVATPNLVG